MVSVWINTFKELRAVHKTLWTLVSFTHYLFVYLCIFFLIFYVFIFINSSNVFMILQLTSVPTINLGKPATNTTMQEYLSGKSGPPLRGLRIACHWMNISKRCLSKSNIKCVQCGKLFNFPCRSKLQKGCISIIYRLHLYAILIRCPNCSQAFGVVCVSAPERCWDFADTLTLEDIKMPILEDVQKRKPILNCLWP